MTAATSVASEVTDSPSSTTHPATVPHLSARQKARKRALDVLYEADLMSHDPLRTLASQPVTNPLTTTLVEGVARRQDEIDRLVAAALADGWSLDRMPTVDRAAARIGTYELLAGDVPAAVAISEAVLLVQHLSTDESPAFLTAVLSRIARELTSTSPGGDLSPLS